MSTVEIESLLCDVERPARYFGGELNMIKKTDARLWFALCFPDIYEIGMSHLGSRILYNVLNSQSDIACERAFAPWPDMERRMRETGTPMFSLESRKPLAEFDVLGFSLLYEMCYTNIFTMLQLAGIPFYSRDRGEDAPLIIAGGPCACNPEPLAPILDAVLIGDGEELILDVSNCIMQQKETGADKRSTLIALSQIPGVYVPAFYGPAYDADGAFLRMDKLEPAAPDRVQRRILKRLEGAEYIGKPILPYLPIVHDRVALELFRGCTRGCRFCQAGFIYRPVRERSVDTLMQQADKLLACTGYDEISLFSLSSGDYSHIHELVPEIIKRYGGRRVSVSLPSLRIDSFIKDDLESMQTVRKAGLTFAPEAGTQRLRDVINKGVTEDDLLRSVTDAFTSGWSSVKLYFMIGLPTETDEDILGIAELARKVSAAFYTMPKNMRGKGLRLAVSASSFVPKPFTPFQWAAQDTKEELIRKQQLLRGALKGIRGVEFSYHAPDISVLEAVFARGDRRLAGVLVHAYEHGARFDSWDEHYKPEVWRAALEECDVKPEYYAHRQRSTDEALPWEHIDMIVTREYLLKERENSMQALVTKDCRQGCNGCFGEKYADYCKA